jgi:uncharacterized protein DUF5677
MLDESLPNDEALRLADILVEKPLTWSQPLSGPCNAPALRFVKFRAFSRAVTLYRSFVLLLKAGQWEDALVLMRSLYELNLNLSEISCSPDPEDAATRFVKFGKFLLLRLDQKRLEDQLRDERLQSKASAEIAEYEKTLADIASKLDRDFAEFRNLKGKWRESWSDANVETRALRLAKMTGGQRGQNDYFVFRLASLFTHSTPGSLFFVLPQDREIPGWNEFRVALDKTGREGVRQFLYEASICLVDIVGIAGDSIAGYERQWFVEFVNPLLDKF